MALLVALDSNRQEVATTILASTNSAEAKIKIVQKALDAAGLEESRRIEISKAVSGLGRLCPQRNDLLHHVWCHRENGEIVTIDYRESDTTKKQTVRCSFLLRRE